MSLMGKTGEKEKKKWGKIWKKSEFGFSKDRGICNILQFCYNFRGYIETEKVIIEKKIHAEMRKTWPGRKVSRLTYQRI